MTIAFTFVFIIAMCSAVIACIFVYEMFTGKFVDRRLATIPIAIIFFMVIVLFMYIIISELK